MDTQQVRLDEMRGAPVFDNTGEKIGKVEEIFYDEGSRRPEWIGIGTGFFGTKRVLVPVEGASVQGDGICVAYAADHVKDSPDIDEDDLSPQAEEDLYRYYGLGGRGAASVPDGDGQTVTRSEEELQVGKQREQAGTVRLRKWVETEPVALDVELRRETARVVRETIDQPVGRDTDAFQEEEVEVPLSAERAVTSKQTVAKERIGVRKDVETQKQTVQDELRKERVEVESDGDVVER